MAYIRKKVEDWEKNMIEKDNKKCGKVGYLLMVGIL